MTERRFHLFVDAQDPDEPGSRYFGSFRTALAALEKYPADWRRFAWIMEHTENGWVPRVRDGKAD